MNVLSWLVLIVLAGFSLGVTLVVLTALALAGSWRREGRWRDE